MALPANVARPRPKPAGCRMLDVVTAGRVSKCAETCRCLGDATAAVSREGKSGAVAARRLADGSVGDGEVAGPVERDEGDAIQRRQQASASGTSGRKWRTQ